MFVTIITNIFPGAVQRSCLRNQQSFDQFSEDFYKNGRAIFQITISEPDPEPVAVNRKFCNLTGFLVRHPLALR